MKIISTGFRTDLMVLGWSGTEITDHQDHLVIRTPSNPSYWWGNFLLLAEPLAAGSGEYWRREFANRFPTAEHLAIGIDGTDGMAGDRHVIGDLGLTVSVDSVLISEELTGSPATAADIRPILTEQDWEQMAHHRLTVDGRESSAAHRRFLLQRVTDDRRLGETGHGQWFGAFVDGRLASTAGIFTDDQGTARYQSVMTDPDFRRRGLATAVVHTAGDWALQEGNASKLVIVAEPDDVAIQIYRRLGFIETERQVGLERG